jgi:hypothetical protein
MCTRACRKQSHAPWCLEPRRLAEQCCHKLYGGALASTLAQPAGGGGGNGGKGGASLFDKPAARAASARAEDAEAGAGDDGDGGGNALADDGDGDADEEQPAEHKLVDEVQVTVAAQAQLMLDGHRTAAAAR